MAERTADTHDAHGIAYGDGERGPWPWADVTHDVQHDHAIRHPEGASGGLKGWTHGFAFDPGKLAPGDVTPQLVAGLDALGQWGWRANKTTRGAIPKKRRSVTKPRPAKRAGNAPAAKPGRAAWVDELESLDAAALDLAYRRAQKRQREAYLQLQAVEHERTRRFSVPGQQMPGGW